MVRIAALIFLMFPVLALAGVDLTFSNVTISELSQLYLKGFLKRDYVLAPEVLSDDRKISISVKNKPETDLQPFLRDFLETYGIAMHDHAGVLYLSKKTNVQPDTQNPIEQLPPPASVSAIAGAVDGEGGGGILDDLPVLIYRPHYRAPSELLALIRYAGGHPSDASNGDFIVYRAPLEKQEFIEGLLADLDKPTGELMVKAYLYEVNTTEKEGSGFSAAVDLLKGKFKINLAGVQQANTLTMSLPNIQAVFSALDTDSRFKVISSPSLRVKNGKLSRFSVGSEVPVLGAITAYNNGQPVQSVTYRPSGVILELTPTILQTGIELQLLQQVSNFVQTQTGVNGSPTLIKRELSTTVSAKDGDLILMGGLDETKHSQDGIGLSLLPSWLHSKTAEKNKTDILLVLHVQRI